MQHPESTWLSAPCGLLAALLLELLCAGPSAGQDVFNSGNGTPCQQVLRQEDRLYGDRLATLQKKEVALRAQADKERSACRSDAACQENALKRSAERIRLLNLERVDEGTRHSKAIVDVEHSDNCVPPLQAARPCDRARQAEDRRYRFALAQLQKKELDLRNALEHDRSDCRSDAVCHTSATLKHQESMRQLNDLRVDEGARRAAVMIDIDRGNCAEAPASKGAPAAPPPVTPPTRPGTPAQGLRPAVKDPANLAEINCPTCTCVDLKASNLQADQLVKDLPAGDYNCFFYAKTFIERRLHTLEPAEGLHKESWADPNYLYQQGYDLVSSGANMNFFKAQLGDLVVVEGDNFPLAYRPWVHIGVVTEAASDGRIYAVRQKPDGGHCVVDLTLENFYKVYPISGNYRYMLYRSRNAPGILPKAK